MQMTAVLTSGVQNRQGEHHVIHSLDAFDFFLSTPNKVLTTKVTNLLCRLLPASIFFKKKLKINYLKQDGDSVGPILVQISL